MNRINKIPFAKQIAAQRGAVATLCIVCTLMTFFCSCKSNALENQYNSTSSDVMDFNFNFVIVDEELQDRLNPESPSYFGEEYIQGIKLLDEQKKEFDPYEYYNSMEEEKMTFIQAPYRWFKGNANTEPMYIYQGTLGYYFIYGVPISTISSVDGAFMLFYIHYPDDSEDVIKLRISHKTGKFGAVHTFDQIWINDELAFERGVWSVEDFFYNTKYFKWLIPVLADDGKQIGVRPKDAFNIALTK